MEAYPHNFEGEVVHHDVGTYRYTVVSLPDEIASRLPFDAHPRLRITGEINDVPFAGAWQPVRGRWYLMLGKPLLRDAGLSVGDVADVRFALDDPDAVDVPDALASALQADGEARSRWDALTSGQRRALAFRVGGGKTAATQDKRVAEVLGFLHGTVQLRIGGKTQSASG